MSNRVTLGGDRLGAGNNQQVEVKNYSRSTSDNGYTWRSSMASGTLVPFMKELALRGDTFDIDLNVDVKTLPTLGPLFGSYKVQLDVFTCPFRLYEGKLHMNMIGVGKKMSEVKLPQVVLRAENRYDHDNAQINPSSIWSYLDVRGLGANRQTGTNAVLQREFNAIPYLAYWDIYKQYYANKQEEIGAVIHNRQDVLNNSIHDFKVWENVGGTWYGLGAPGSVPASNIALNPNSFAVVEFTYENQPQPEELLIEVLNVQYRIDQVFQTFSWSFNNGTGFYELLCTDPWANFYTYRTWEGYLYDGTNTIPSQVIPQVTTFELANIDWMRMQLLKSVDSATAYEINTNSKEPYNLSLEVGNTGLYSKLSSQEGLGLKTYQSDLFNNWVSKEWFDGVDSINALSSVDTTGGSFSMDTLNIAQKVYEMMNRIAVTDGTYEGWQDAVWTNESTRSVENPVYEGGLIKELAFQEVVSNAMSTNEQIMQPLGTLAGKGVLTNKHKGGKIRIKVNEPSYIMGIVSLTPRIDYSQGNKWDVNLKTMDDLHKPGMDGIGFQDLITEQMAWWDTDMGVGITQKSAGKQPAWINYKTNVNICKGNFADSGQMMFMTLNRRYEQDANGIKDLTTYIDPSKYNYIFADTRLDAQNFMTQIKVDITKRSLISASLIPNL